MDNYNKQVIQAYARTISHGDHETAIMLALRRIGLAVIVGALVSLTVTGCNADRADGAANTPVVSAAAKAPTLLTFMPGTQWRHYKLDADITFRGQDQTGAVIMDIRVDGTQHLKVLYPDPGEFLITVVKNPDWINAGIPPVNQKRD